MHRQQGPNSRPLPSSARSTYSHHLPPRRESQLTLTQLALFISALDATIVATAIPTIASALDHSGSGYMWIGGAYLLANAASGPIWAKCSDIWGRKPILLFAVALFAGASIVAATSVSMNMLIAGRALQGTGAGGCTQLVFITISDLFSVRKRGLYLGLTELVWALAGGLGPILGGAFTEYVSFRWCFWINLPVCGIAFVLLTLFLDVHNPKTKFSDGIRAIDWFGTFAILSVTIMLLLGLDFGGTVAPWDSAKVICLIVFGAVMIVFFLFSEKKLATYPLMPLDMFRNRSTAAASLVTFCHGFVFIAAEFYLPLYFQSVKGASPLRSGVLLLPVTLSTAAMGVVSGVVINSTGRYREIIWTGMALLTVGTGLYLLLDTSTSVAKIVGFQIIGGVGSGCLFHPPLIAIQALVRQQDTASATATQGFIRCMSLSMSIVLGGVIFQNSVNLRVSELVSTGDLRRGIAASFSDGKAAASVEMIKGIADAAERYEVRRAFAWSMRNMFIMYTAVSFIGFAVSLLIRHANLSQEHTETQTGIEKMSRRNEQETAQR